MRFFFFFFFLIVSVHAFFRCRCDRVDRRRGCAVGAWARRPRRAQALALRSRIVLLAGEGLRPTPRSLRGWGSRATRCAKWRKRFAEHRLDGLTDEPRPGRPRTISDEQVEEVIVKTLETTPEGRDALVDAVDGHRGRADPDGGARGSGRRSGCSPIARRPSSSRRTRCSSTRSATSSGSISTRPKGRSCSASMRSPRSRRSTAPRRSCRCCPGCPSARPTTTSATAPRASTPRWTSRTGKVIGRLHQPSSRDRVQEVPADDRPRGPRPISRSTSCSTTPAPTRRRRSRSGCPPTPGSCLHFTPTSSSWLNLVERWFAELTTKKLRRGAHRSIRALNTDIRAWIEHLERGPQALRLDQDRRPDPRLHQPLLHPN